LESDRRHPAAEQKISVYGVKMKRATAPKIALPNLPNKIWVGVDNGVSGTIGWSGYHNNIHIYGQIKTPTFSELKYTKAKANVTRINVKLLKDFLEPLQQKGQLSILLERPMVNPGRFQASISAMRALEATLNVLEFLEISHQYIDSKQWQKIMLPSGLKGADQLKKASLSIGKRLFPSVDCKPDADGILIAEWARRTNI